MRAPPVLPKQPLRRDAGAIAQDRAADNIFLDVLEQLQREGAFALVLEQAGSFHPEEPHWYLPLIGVDPIEQGRGCGSALLRVGLSRCDADRLPAYLESTNPKNIPLYERYGFE